jgi:propanol-preferring alcohol dehydrogenase
MVFTGAGRPLAETELADQPLASGQVRLEVRACGVCRTDLHVVDGDLAEPKLPLVLGHQIVGTVSELGAGVDRFVIGERVGVPWLGWTCGECAYCRKGRENLCDRARFTGYTVDGGYSQRAVADARYCFPIPDGYPDLQAAPLLCAGLIGYRALMMTGEAERVGLYGFGAAAHIVCQVACSRGRRVFAFSRPGDLETQAFAESLGAEWAGGSSDRPPEPLDAAIIFAPVGGLVPALAAVDRGGTVVCAGIHMSEIPAFPYELLWEERALRARWPTSRGATAMNSWHWRHRSRSAPRSTPSTSQMRTPHSMHYARGRSTAPSCSTSSSSSARRSRGLVAPQSVRAFFAAFFSARLRLLSSRRSATCSFAPAYDVDTSSLPPVQPKTITTSTIAKRTFQADVISC